MSYSFKVDSLLVQVYNSQSELAEDVAFLIQSYLQEVLTQQGKATVLLATGNSQIEFLNTLTRLGNIDWSKITCFHLDEYLGINREHPASFRYYLRERVEKRVNPEMFYYIEGDTVQPLEECDRYTKLLRSQPIDLCCLGLGENGHLAFNEPSVTNFNDSRSINLVKLDDVTRQQQVNGGYFSSLDSVPTYAFTLTIPIICSAKKIICLAPGKNKIVAVREMLESAISPQCPASILRKQAQATLFLDTDSAIFK